jgi:hypothetical protein
LQSRPEIENNTLKKDKYNACSLFELRGLSKKKELVVVTIFKIILIYALLQLSVGKPENVKDIDIHRKGKICFSVLNEILVL